MKKFSLAILLTFFSILSVLAQKGYTAKSGDSELDNNLKNINANGKVDLKLFKKDLSVNFDISEGKLDELMVSYNLQPADLYMVLEIGKISKRPYEDVGQSFKTNQGKGWGVIAKEMGIKPGSEEFHMLKNQAKGKSKHGQSQGKGKGHEKDKKGKGKKK